MSQAGCPCLGPEPGREGRSGVQILGKKGSRKDRTALLCACVQACPGWQELHPGHSGLGRDEGGRPRVVPLA